MPNYPGRHFRRFAIRDGVFATFGIVKSGPQRTRIVRLLDPAGRSYLVPNQELAIVEPGLNDPTLEWLVGQPEHNYEAPERPNGWVSGELVRTFETARGLALAVLSHRCDDRLVGETHIETMDDPARRRIGFVCRTCIRRFTADLRTVRDEENPFFKALLSTTNGRKALSIFASTSKQVQRFLPDAWRVILEEGELYPDNTPCPEIRSNWAVRAPYPSGCPDYRIYSPDQFEQDLMIGIEERVFEAPTRTAGEPLHRQVDREDPIPLRRPVVRAEPTRLRRVRRDMWDQENHPPRAEDVERVEEDIPRTTTPPELGEMDWEENEWFNDQPVLVPRVQQALEPPTVDLQLQLVPRTPVGVTGVPAQTRRQLQNQILGQAQEEERRRIQEELWHEIAENRALAGRDQTRQQELTRQLGELHQPTLEERHRNFQRRRAIERARTHAGHWVHRNNPETGTVHWTRTNVDYATANQPPRVDVAPEVLRQFAETGRTEGIDRLRDMAQQFLERANNAEMQLQDMLEAAGIVDPVEVETQLDGIPEDIDDPEFPGFGEVRVTDQNGIVWDVDPTR